MPIELSDAEIETVKALLDDWGWDYGLTAKRDEVIALCKRLGLTKHAKDFEL